MVAAIDEAQSQGVHCASAKLPDGPTLVIVLTLDEGTWNPRPAVEAFQGFQHNLIDVDILTKQWLGTTP